MPRCPRIPAPLLELQVVLQLAAAKGATAAAAAPVRCRLRLVWLLIMTTLVQVQLLLQRAVQALLLEAAQLQKHVLALLPFCRKLQHAWASSSLLRLPQHHGHGTAVARVLFPLHTQCWCCCIGPQLTRRLLMHLWLATRTLL